MTTTTDSHRTAQAPAGAVEGTRRATTPRLDGLPTGPAGAAQVPGAAGSSTGRRRRWSPAALGLGLVLPTLLLVVWQVVTVTGRVEPSVLPPPVDVVTEAQRLLANGDFWENIRISVQRVSTGFLVGGGLAVVVGVAVGLSRTADRLLSPSLVAVRAVPSLAWIPLLIIWAGIGETPKVVLIAIGAFFPVLATLVAGIRQVDVGLLEVAKAYGLGRRRTITTVLLPSAAPSLLAGARLGLAQSWLFLVAAELIASSRGLGFLLVDSQNTGRVDGVLLAIVLLALFGTATDAVLRVLERTVTARLS